MPAAPAPAGFWYHGSVKRLLLVLLLLAGSLADLRQPDAVIIDRAGYEYMWPGQPYELGRTLEMNDHRAVVVGVCKAVGLIEPEPDLARADC